MALTISNLKTERKGRALESRCTIAFDSSYPTGGESLTAADLGLTDIQVIQASPSGGYVFEYDDANAKLLAYRYGGASGPTFTGTAPTGSTVNVIDDDNAASTGVAVYVHVDEVVEDGSIFAHLEFVSPTNADASGTISNGGATYQVIDDDNAASGGVALYLDEDGTAGSRFLANTGADCYVTLSNGDFLKITANATPGTPGVQVYLDEDAANSYERLLFVSPTDTDATDTTPAALTLREGTPAGTVAALSAAALAEVANATNLSAVTNVQLVATGV